MVQPLCKEAWQFLKMLNVELPHDLEILFIGVHPKKLNMYLHKDLYVNPRGSIIHNHV